MDAKLLFRKGTAHLHLSDYEEAIKDLTAALELAPNDTTISAKLKQAKRLHEQKRKREMQIFSKVFKEASKES
ncbi:tetratricopeptide repeat protein [archaeon]|nr:MAG: tetratricopeptide repeat protein [archaeon]